MIELDDVFVLYRGSLHDVVALRGLTLNVASGERVVVNGPSGSGKSTLINVVTAVVAPSAGRARIMGHDVGDRVAAVEAQMSGRTWGRKRSRRPSGRAISLGPSLMGGRNVEPNSKPDYRSVLNQRTDRVGIITQGTGRDLIPELTCLDNVALQARLDGQSGRSARADGQVILRRFDLDHLADRYPTTLSNGEAQRIGVAAALACRPGVIVADEPTGELDNASADDVYDLLAEQTLETGACLLLVTHDDRASRVADRVITIRDGRVSSESANGVDALIVDGRGWIRIPESARRNSGIANRAIASEHDGAVVFTAPGIGAAQAEKVDSVLALEHWDGVASDTNPTTVQGILRIPIIQVHDVAVSISGVEILPPVSTEIFSGELTAIIGRSGSGKTTLLSILGNLDKPTSGTIDCDAETSVAISSGVAGFAEHLSVARNLDIACHVRNIDDHNGDALLENLGISHLRDRAMATLSGGERQRVSVARALVTNAELVLLDEPTSQLDEASTALVVAVLVRCAREGRAIICTTHDPAVEAASDNVITLGRH
jgi:ABC-type lipoprotein export system ATPase subunit